VHLSAVLKGVTIIVTCRTVTRVQHALRIMQVQVRVQQEGTASTCMPISCHQPH
jgi:hypothetical protein